MAAAVTQDGTATDVTEITAPVTMEGRKIMVLYGSETGNAEDMAIELSKMTRRLHFTTVVDEMDNIKLAELIQYPLAIFVTSTTGQGELPRNTERFWANLRRTRLNDTNCLGRLSFTIFGLGDSSYPNVNAAARKLRSRLKQLGASEFFKAGEADERHENGNDSIYLPWSRELREHLLTNYPLPESLQPLSDDTQLPPRYFVDLSPPMEVQSSSEASAVTDEQRFLETKTLPAVRTHVDRPRSDFAQINADMLRLKETFQISARASNVWERDHPREFGSLDKDNVITDYPKKYLLKEPSHETPQGPPDDILDIPGTHLATIDDNERMTPSDHWQDVRKITFTLSLKKADKRIHEFLPYTAGATLLIYPKNYPEDVQKLLDMMNWGLYADHCVNQKSERCNLPKGVFFKATGATTFQDLLINNFDITSIPKRSFLSDLVHYTQIPEEKERLQELTRPGGEEEFYDYASRPRRTILEVLGDFPGVMIPAEHAFDLFPIIRPREFSIANGAYSIGEMNYDDNDDDLITIEILAALVEYKTVIRKPRQGLCSRYLKHIKPGTLVRVGIKPPTSPLLRPENMLTKVPVNNKTELVGRPILAVATGTGIAPIRALVDDRIAAGVDAPVLLFFGCRNQHADFFFKEDWDDVHCGRAARVRVIPAFSRDEKPHETPPAPIPEATTDDGKKNSGGGGANLIRPATDPKPLGLIDRFDYDRGKNYVQHQIRRHAQEVARHLSTGRAKPVICVCGNAGRMPTAVREALEDALVIGKVVDTKEEARAWLKDTKKVFYWQETW